MTPFRLKVNGREHMIEAAEDTPLLWVLRDHLDLVGTKFGCGIGQCGACTVHINGAPARACITPASVLAEAEITTIEGLSAAGDHPLQKAWCDLDVPQCGYCQSGQIMTAAPLLNNNPKPTDDEIKEAMAGNLCRCATYLRIRAGVRKASGQAPGLEEVSK